MANSSRGHLLAAALTVLVGALPALPAMAQSVAGSPQAAVTPAPTRPPAPPAPPISAPVTRPAAPPSAVVVPAPMPTPSQPGDPRIIAPPLRAILQNAAALGGVQERDVLVMHLEPTMWGDSSLGCTGDWSFPRDPTPRAGFGVAVRVGDRVLDYRTDDLRNLVILCAVFEDRPRPPRAEDSPNTALATAEESATE